ncbi:tellurium resistance protein TerC [Chryseobacterium sp. RP-3-3]|uniref:Tellurium resistance protein TerC n=1 Tax=Chryseobacterium antibioticum TaxID=2728847 RepID=A0A7Y0ANU4_9FLAO|nr:MauE/DoxX family redox-associated membrane protein [Chryseobacterium antibioticum]NML70773.1 tellurium resistance protein TerC [Chryseobacterium antibioticum]
MKKTAHIITMLIAYFFVLLFCYAGMSKALDFENFQIQIAQSPLLTAFAGFTSYSVIIVELIIVFLLLIPRLRLIGLYASLGLMTAFTIYIYLILNYSDFVPCSCGGVLEKMDWNEHLLFNIACVVLALSAIVINRNKQYSLYKVYFKIITTIVISGLTVIFLFINSENNIKKENGFTRRFLPHPIIEDKVLELDNEHYYFAGNNDEQIFLGNKSTPLILTSVGHTFTVLKSMRIYPDQTDFTYTNLQFKVAGFNYYLYDGSVPIIYKGKTTDSLARTVSHNDIYFNQLAVVDSAHFAVRIRSSETSEYELGMLSINEQPKFRLLATLLEKQIDGVFDADGQLLTNAKSKNILYMYAYRNQFLIMNNQLQLKRRLKTIDTISKAQIQPVKLSDGNRKLRSPPLKVNSGLTANGTLLFNQSHLMGKHEPRERWRNATVIDIYRTDKQEYMGSFYIDHIDRQPVSQIMVTDQYLYAIIGRRLIRYQYRTSNVKYFTTGEAENLIQE